jgi:hypothetical protein
MKLRVASAVLAPAMLAVTAVLASAGGASAATSPAAGPAAAASVTAGSPISPSFCSGDVCTRIYLPPHAPNFSKIVVRIWARSYSFYGHFELKVPGVAKPYNTGDTTNRAGATGALFEVPNNDGRFTVYAWLQTGPRSWAGIGSTGFNGAYI